MPRDLPGARRTGAHGRRPRRGTTRRPARVAPAGPRQPSYDDRRGPAFEDPRFGDQRYQDHRYADQRGVSFDDSRRSELRQSDDDYYRGKPKKRKKSFLEEFFD